MALILKLPVGATSGGNNGGGSTTTPSTASLNVFCQMEEPEIKEGIWIQSDKGYENVVVDSAIYKVGGTWVDVETEYSNLYKKGQYDTLVGIKNNVAYFFYSGYYFRTATYDFTTNTYAESEEIAAPTKHYEGDYCIIGDYLYTFGGYVSSSGDTVNYGYKYSLSNLNNAPTKLSTLPNSMNFWHETHVMVSEDEKYVYLYGGFKNSSGTTKYGGLYKYDVDNDKFSEILAPTGFGGYSGTSVLIGDYIYTFGGYDGSTYHCNVTRKININTGEITTLATNSKIENGKYDSVQGIAIGGDIYLIHYTANKVFCYNTATDTYTEVLSGIPETNYAISRPFIYNNRIFFSSSSVLNIGTKDFNNGDFIIQRTDWSRGKYETQFHGDTSYGVNFGRICSGFDNAWLYTDNDFNTTLPTYYGDGTKWVKFKN